MAVPCAQVATHTTAMYAWRFADRYTDHQSWTHDPCARRRASTFRQVEAIADTILQWNRLRVVK